MRNPIHRKKLSRARPRPSNNYIQKIIKGSALRSLLYALIFYYGRHIPAVMVGVQQVMGFFQVGGSAGTGTQVVSGFLLWLRQAAPPV